jgi:hypothetical protein
MVQKTSWLSHMVKAILLGSICLKSKNEALKKFQTFMAMIENINNCQKNVLNWMKVKTLFQGNFVIFATRKYFIKIK